MEKSGPECDKRRRVCSQALDSLPDQLRRQLLECQPCPFCDQRESKDGAHDHLVKQTYCFLILGIIHNLPELSIEYIRRQFPSLESLTLQTVTAFFLGRPRDAQSVNEDGPFQLAYAEFLLGAPSPSREHRSSQQRETSFFRCIQFVMARGSACIAFFLGFWALAFPKDTATLTLFRQLGGSTKPGEELFSKSWGGFKKLFMANAQIQHQVDCGSRPNEPCDGTCTSLKPVSSFTALRVSYKKHFTRALFVDNNLGVGMHVRRRNTANGCMFHKTRRAGSAAVITIDNIMRGLQQMNLPYSRRDTYPQTLQLPVHEFLRICKDIFYIFKIFFLATVLTDQPAIPQPSLLHPCCAKAAAKAADPDLPPSFGAKPLCCQDCIRGTPFEAVYNVMKQFDRSRTELLENVAKLNEVQKSPGDVKPLVQTIATLLRACHPAVSLEPIRRWFSEDGARQAESWPQLQIYISKTAVVATSTLAWKQNLLEDPDHFNRMFNVFLATEAGVLRPDVPPTRCKDDDVADFVGRVLGTIDAFAARARISGGPLSPDGERAETSTFSQPVIERKLGMFEMTYLCAALDVLTCVQKTWSLPNPLLPSSHVKRRGAVLQVLRDRRFLQYTPFIGSMKMTLQKKMGARAGSSFHELQHPTDVQRIREMGCSLKEKIMALVHECSTVLRFLPRQLTADNLASCPSLAPPSSREIRGFILNEEHLATIAVMLLPHLMKGLLGPCYYINSEKIEEELFCPVAKSCLNLRGLQPCKICDSATLCSRCNKGLDICTRCTAQEKESRQETAAARPLAFETASRNGGGSDGLAHERWHEELAPFQPLEEALPAEETYDPATGLSPPVDPELLAALTSVDAKVGLLQEFGKECGEVEHEFRTIGFFKKAALNLDNFGTAELMRLYDILYILLVYLLKITKGQVPAGAAAQLARQEPDALPPCNGRCLDRTSPGAGNSEQLRRNIQTLLDTFSCTELGVVGIKDPYMLRLCVNVYIATIDCERHKNLFIKVLLEDEFLRHVGQVHCRSSKLFA